jgi:acyl-CoA thioester hydrolase
MISTPLHIRFADCDLAGHIHNAVYLHYFESGRINFFVSELGNSWDWKTNGLIIKKNVLIHHQPGVLTDELSIEVSCTHIGNTSFTLSYHIMNERGQLLTEGSSVVVCYDYIQDNTISIPSKMMDVLKKHSITVDKA